MTVKDFVAQVEAYYGKYERSAQKAIVSQYLQQKFSSHDLDILHKWLILEYSGQYRFTPDVAIIETVVQKINKDSIGWQQGIPLAIRFQTEPRTEEGHKQIRELIKKLVEKKKIYRQQNKPNAGMAGSAAGGRKEER